MAGARAFALVGVVCVLGAIAGAVTATASGPGGELRGPVTETVVVAQPGTTVHVSASPAFDRFTAGFVDNASVTADGAQLVRGEEYAWNATDGGLTVDGVAAGERVDVTYWYYHRPPGGGGVTQAGVPAWSLGLGALGVVSLAGSGVQAARGAGRGQALAGGGGR